MGPGMSGLVHTSKIYSVLASGKPFVFVGPNPSHVSDLVRVNSLGAVVESGQAGLLAATILETQKLSLEAKEHIRNVSHAIVRNYSPGTNLSSFYKNVIQERQPNAEEAYPLSAEPVTDEG